MPTAEPSPAGVDGARAVGATHPSSTDPTAGDPSSRGTRIVVGVDGSWCSLAALRWAAAEGSLRHVPVHVVLAWQLSGVMGMSPMLLPPGYDLQTEGRQTLDGILAEHTGAPADRPAGSPITSEVVNSDPATALLGAASDAALLVVGSRGHGGFTDLVIGSVSQHCLIHAPCPVVVIHAPENQ